MSRKRPNKLKFRNILLGTLLSFTCLANVSFAKADTYSAPGAINNGAGGQVGNIDRNGNIYNGGGGQIGNIASDGTIYNGGGGQIGKIGGDGTIYNGGGGVVGNIASDGTVYNGGGGVVGHVPAGTVSALTHNNGAPSLARQEAEIRQMQQPAPARQDQPSCVIGCSITPALPYEKMPNIRRLDGFLVGWKNQNDGRSELRINALPELQLDSAVSEKVSGVDTRFIFKVGEPIYRNISDKEISLLQKKNSQRAQEAAESGFLRVGQIDSSGQITDLKGKKIAYVELGDAVYDTYELGKDAKEAGPYGGEFSYPNVLGVCEMNGDIRDVHNRFVGHIEQNQRYHGIGGSLAALKLIQKYEKQHPWHSAAHKMMKSPLK